MTTQPPAGFTPDWELAPVQWTPELRAQAKAFFQAECPDYADQWETMAQWQRDSWAREFLDA